MPFLTKGKIEYPSEKRGYQNELCEIFWVFLRSNVRDDSSKSFITRKCPFFHPEVPRFEPFFAISKMIFFGKRSKNELFKLFYELGLDIFCKKFTFLTFLMNTGPKNCFLRKRSKSKKFFFKIKKVLFELSLSSANILELFEAFFGQKCFVQKIHFLNFLRFSS